MYTLYSIYYRKYIFYLIRYYILNYFRKCSLKIRLLKTIYASRFIYKKPRYNDICYL